jgi:hypothetical protein
MLDLLYILGTIGFFALMIGYVSFCERIGRSDDARAMSSETRP